MGVNASRQLNAGLSLMSDTWKGLQLLPVNGGMTLRPQSYDDR